MMCSETSSTDHCLRLQALGTTTSTSTVIKRNTILRYTCIPDQAKLAEEHDDEDASNHPDVMGGKTIAGAAHPAIYLLCMQAMMRGTMQFVATAAPRPDGGLLRTHSRAGRVACRRPRRLLTRITHRCSAVWCGNSGALQATRMLPSPSSSTHTW